MLCDLTYYILSVTLLIIINNHLYWRPHFQYSNLENHISISVGGTPITPATVRPTYATTTRPYWTRTASGWIHIKNPPLYKPDGQIYTSDEQSAETKYSSEELYDPSTFLSPSSSSASPALLLPSDASPQRPSAQEHDLSQLSQNALVRLSFFVFPLIQLIYFKDFWHLTLHPVKNIH